MKGNYQRATELHNLAAHSHQAAAVHHGKEDHATGNEHSRQAMEHSAKAFLQSLDTDRASAKLTGKTSTSGSSARGSRIARRRGK